jgi:hypothetical protein
MSYEESMERAKGCGAPRGLGRGVNTNYMDPTIRLRCAWCNELIRDGKLVWLNGDWRESSGICDKCRKEKF